MEVITGLRPADSGTVLIDGHDHVELKHNVSTGLNDVTHATARYRRELGLSHVPEDRNGRGLVTPYTAAMNSILGDHYHPPYATRFGLLDESAIEDHATRLIKDYDVRPTDPNITVSHYSGGNAQKLIVARELERQPSVLVMAQPTRGVDIGAIEFIHRQIVDARDSGIPVLLVSADLNEILSLSDRIIVMFQGRIMGELSQAEATPEKLGLLMAGSTDDKAAPAA